MNVSPPLLLRHILVSCVSMCETYGVLQDNTEHPPRAWLMSGAFVTVPAGQMKRYESAGRLENSSGYRQFCQH